MIYVRPPTVCSKRERIRTLEEKIQWINLLYMNHSRGRTGFIAHFENLSPFQSVKWLVQQKSQNSHLEFFIEFLNHMNNDGNSALASLLPSRMSFRCPILEENDNFHIVDPQIFGMERDRKMLFQTDRS